MISKTSDLMRPSEAAAYLNMHRVTLHRLSERDSNFPRKIKAGERLCYYRKSDLDEWLHKKQGAVKPVFKKSDLKDGMRVCTYSGDLLYVCGEYLLSRENSSTSFFNISNYSSDMRHAKGKAHDIEKVIERDGSILFFRKLDEYANELGLSDCERDRLVKSWFTI